MLVFLLLLAYAFGDAGFDDPAFYHEAVFQVKYGGATGTDVDAASAGISTTVATQLNLDSWQVVQISHDDVNKLLEYSVRGKTIAEADGTVVLLEDDAASAIFCSNLQSTLQVAGWTTDAVCVQFAYIPVTFTVTYGGVDGDALNTKETELADEVAHLTGVFPTNITLTMPTDAADADFEVTITNFFKDVASAEEFVNSLDGPTFSFCTPLQAAMDAELTGFTSGAGCLSEVLGATAPAFTNLNTTCESGDFEVSGVSTGTAVQLNFANSGVSIDTEDMKSYLSLEFEVPTMYFYNDQILGTETYDRSLAITFHNRECSDSNGPITTSDGSDTGKTCDDVGTDLTANTLTADDCPSLSASVAAYGDANIALQCRKSCNNCALWEPDTSACYTSKTNYTECPSMEMGWTHEDSTTANIWSCSQRLTGKLLFEDLLYGSAGRNDGIIVTNGSRTINGVLFDTWEVYMVAYVETWAGYVQTSDDAGNGNLDFNNPNSVVSDWTGHLEINQERYSYYALPFIVAFPKTITIEASPITSFAQMIVLYAVVEQDMLTINFTPDTANGEVFGSAEVLVKTQVQFPYGLRTSSDSSAPAQVGIDTAEHTRHGQAVTADTIIFTTEQDSTHCDGAVAHGEYCVQEWKLTITPNLCDISGHYYLKFWATCFDTTSVPTQCALDINAGSGTGNEVDCVANPNNVACTNSYSGKLEFSITAQEFCPEVLDTIETEGTIAIYADPEFSVTATPGTNLFVNDHVYVETTFLTKSSKSGDTYVGGDDTLIEFVRPFKIQMDVAMAALPLQTSVDSSNGDVTFPSATDAKNYEIVLCSVDELAFPYTDSNLNTDCFDTANQGWNAINRLAFTKQTTSGVNGNPPVNSADANEILFSLRLDERVIPVDLPNTASQITISQDVEIYYIGNTNPVRRRLTQTRRRLEQTQRQTNRVATTFDITPNNNIAFCTLRDHLMFTGFELEVITDLLEIPETQADSVAHLNDVKFALASYLNLDPTVDIEIYKMDHCSAKDCSELFPRRGLREIQYMRYYIDIKNSAAANRFQTELMTRSSGIYSTWLEGKVLQGMRVDHCEPEVSDLFNGYRTVDAQNDVFDSEPIEEESSAWAVGVLALAPLMALLHL